MTLHINKHTCSCCNKSKFHLVDDIDDKNCFYLIAKTTQFYVQKDTILRLLSKDRQA